ncbi:uncharacterized protein EAF01_008098 [Botrytis porri]|uniref:uncharacterized protein n=1 Tax=Botrytis porri TaxID=87229 RepID=UPI001901E9FA|nr:uncharacterized protein EAF01_008098 [Botrytis porri]KAF7898885.1 hypothetical protein EAF01_008098 [Botrytis porri]
MESERLFSYLKKKVKGEHYEMGKHMAPTPQRLPPKSPSLRVPRHMSEVNVLKRTKNFFQPLIKGERGPRGTGPGTGRNWLQWGIHGLVPFGWKDTGVGEDWEEDGGEEWNHEFIGPRVEFLVEDGKDRNRATRDIFLV